MFQFNLVPTLSCSDIEGVVLKLHEYFEAVENHQGSSAHSDHYLQKERGLYTLGWPLVVEWSLDLIYACQMQAYSLRPSVLLKENWPAWP